MRGFETGTEGRGGVMLRKGVVLSQTKQKKEHIKKKKKKKEIRGTLMMLFLLSRSLFLFDSQCSQLAVLCGKPWIPNYLVDPCGK
mmetsp:Transcript_83632/g.97837  ORF Transcript_83632/g.97837 Transcript_83632/m.97837 type:complete len:85 (+) Transcript_83632:173-427(+)